MGRHFLRCVLTIASALGISSTFAEADEPRDVLLTTRHIHGRPKSADFYVDGRAVGSGREAFLSIVEKIGRSPPGTSVVWGPNYNRCGSCGDEPGCVPKFLYPELWAKLETHIRERGLTLSSDYPGRLRTVAGDQARSLLTEAVVSGLANPSAQETTTLQWEIGPIAARPGKSPDDATISGERLHRFRVGNQTIKGYSLEEFFGRLPEGSRLQIRMAFSPEVKVTRGVAVERELTHAVQTAWTELLNSQIRRGSLKVTLIGPSRLMETLSDDLRKNVPFEIGWTNFRGPETPHEEVLYTVHGRFVGRGESGFDELLEQIGQLPQGGLIQRPRYRYSGRWAFEGMSEEQRQAENLRLEKLVPFADRRDLFDRTVADRQRKIGFEEISLPGREPRTAFGWLSTDRYGSVFVSTGRIVWHDAQPRPAAARLGWVEYDAHLLRQRALENEAVYTLDDVQVGAGIEGFARAMERLATLPEGAVVHVPVCVRTRAPFTCPIVYEGKRHFERTGLEPYAGMFLWLQEVARARKLELEWIPDQQKSCADCEIAK